LYSSPDRIEELRPRYENLETIDKVLNTGWRKDAQLNLRRGYNTAVTRFDGTVFTIGGTWQVKDGNEDPPKVGGSTTGKYGELWPPSASEPTKWQKLEQASSLPFRLRRSNTADPLALADDTYAHLIPSPDGRVLVAGPQPAMHWYTLSGKGSYELAGVRGSDSYSHNAVVVTYSAGKDSIKVLKAGGAEYYSWGKISNNSYSIEIDAKNKIRSIPKSGMNTARVFANSVVLPNGKVMVIGGRKDLPSEDKGATGDDNAVYKPEVWDSDKDTWQDVAPMKIPRNYHSVALLLKDGRVWAAGGGFCSSEKPGDGAGCLKITHPNGEFYSPGYLFKGERPNIKKSPSAISYEKPFKVDTDTRISYFSLIRLSSVTHSVNTDQRFIKLDVQDPKARINPKESFVQGKKVFTYNLRAPSNKAAVPGLYFLFALNQQGVPSIASTIRIGK
jgi:Domain of unknown function (DUF1929)/Kelch motif